MKLEFIVHYDRSAIKRFLTSVGLQHELKANDVITLVKKTFFAQVSYEILYNFKDLEEKFWVRFFLIETISTISYN